MWKWKKKYWKKQAGNINMDMYSDENIKDVLLTCMAEFVTQIVN